MAKIAEVQEVSLTSLKPYAKNAKIHGEEQIEKLKDSISAFGFLNPCLIDRDFNIIAGHGRVMAAQELGWKAVPCVFIEGLTEAERKAYILADNRLAELASWDMDIVNDQLDELANMDFDIELTGFEKENEDAFSEERVGVNFKDSLSVVVECETEDEAENLYNEFTERGLKCRISTL